MSVHWRHQQAHAQRPHFTDNPCRATEARQKRGRSVLCAQRHTQLKGLPSGWWETSLPLGAGGGRELLEERCHCRAHLCADTEQNERPVDANSRLLCGSQLLAPTVSLEVPVLALCQLYAHTEQIIHVGLFSLPGISTKVWLLQPMIWGFEICVSIFGAARWIRSCPNSC